jgi:hypothetical protein
VDHWESIIAAACENLSAMREKKKPVPADIECPDEDSARAMAESQQSQESDPTIFWVERRRLADGQWVAHASRTGDDQSALRSVLTDVLNPLHWLGIKGTLMPEEPGSALDPSSQTRRRSKYYD